MYAFEYHRPESLEAALAALGSDDATPLAGGQTLLPTLKQRLASASMVVDISRLAELKGISVEGGEVRIGATTTHDTVANSAEVRGAIPALADLAGGIGDPAVRNLGTIGGSIANNDPAADYPAGALALNATIVTNKREIGSDAFFTGLFETALDSAELIVSVRFPVPAKAAYMKFDQPASRYALTGVFVAQHKDGGVRVAVTGAGQNGVFRHTALEQSLSSSFDATTAEGIQADASDMIADLHGSPEYRANLVRVMGARAVAACA